MASVFIMWINSSSPSSSLNCSIFLKAYGRISCNSHAVRFTLPLCSVTCSVVLFTHEHLHATQHGHSPDSQCCYMDIKESCLPSVLRLLWGHKFYVHILVCMSYKNNAIIIPLYLDSCKTFLANLCCKENKHLIHIVSSYGKWYHPTQVITLSLHSYKTRFYL